MASRSVGKVIRSAPSISSRRLVRYRSGAPRFHSISSHSISYTEGTCCIKVALSANASRRSMSINAASCRLRGGEHPLAKDIWLWRFVQSVENRDSHMAYIAREAWSGPDSSIRSHNPARFWSRSSLCSCTFCQVPRNLICGKCLSCLRIMRRNFRIRVCSQCGGLNKTCSAPFKSLSFAKRAALDPSWERLCSSYGEFVSLVYRVSRQRMPGPAGRVFGRAQYVILGK